MGHKALSLQLSVMYDTESTCMFSFTNIILKTSTLTRKFPQDFPLCPPCFTRNSTVPWNSFTEDVTILRAEPNKYWWLGSTYYKFHNKI